VKRSRLDFGAVTADMRGCDSLSSIGDRHKKGAHGGNLVSPVTSYIIPPMSGMPPPPAMAGCFSGTSATTASVVRMFFAIDAAF
jgi:hypothetical protein